MWFMPSYGRPERLTELLQAPGGWPNNLLWLVNADDQCLKDYRRNCLQHPRWIVGEIPVGSRCADAHRFASEHFPTTDFFGLLMDDLWPITFAWWQAMEKAAEDRYVVVANGEPSFPLCRGAICIGGGLVRAMGSLVPAALKHNFEDNIWDDVAREFNLLRPLPDYVVEHHHHIRGTAAFDATYERGSADFSNDAAVYQNWLVSDDKKRMNERIVKFLASENTGGHQSA